MTNVIRLVVERPWTAASTPRSGTARIILFMGVRYVRDETAVSSPGATIATGATVRSEPDQTGRRQA